MRARARLSSTLAWALFSLVMVAWAPGAYYDQFSDEVTSGLDRLWAVSFLAFPAVGVFLARRLPSNPVGWMFLVGPALIGAGVASSEYGEAVGLDLVAWSDAVFEVGLVVLFSSILLFPDGRYPNRWYRRAHLAGIVALAIGLLVGEELEGIAIAFNFVLSVVALINRLIVGSAVVRRQIAGPVFVALLGLFLVALLSVEDLFVTSEGSDFGTIFATLSSVFMTVGIPISIAVAITRYRLYEIDRIISRTVGYLLVVGLLGAGFFAVVTVLSSVFPAESQLAVAGSTLAVAALFNPLRTRVQSMVDRRFNRSRYDAQRVLDRLSASMRDEIDPESVREQWLGAVVGAMEPASVAVWVRGGE